MTQSQKPCKKTPTCCDVIVQRWQDFTGQGATRDG